MTTSDFASSIQVHDVYGLRFAARGGVIGPPFPNVSVTEGPVTNKTEASVSKLRLSTAAFLILTSLWPSINSPPLSVANTTFDAALMTSSVTNLSFSTSSLLNSISKTTWGDFNNVSFLSNDSAVVPLLSKPLTIFISSSPTISMNTVAWETYLSAPTRSGISAPTAKATSGSGDTLGSINSSHGKPTGIVSSPAGARTYTGRQLESSKQILETSLSRVIPDILSWIKEPTRDTDPLLGRLEAMEDSARDLLTNLVDDGQQSGTCSRSLFGLLTCIVTDLTNIKQDINAGLYDDLEGNTDDLSGVVSLLNTDDEQGGETSSSLSSSISSCAYPTTVKEYDVVCARSTLIFNGTTHSCTTATRESSGCNINVSKTTTTSTTGCTKVFTSEEYFVSCHPTVVGTVNNVTQVCSTSTSIVIGCSLTDSTATSTPSYPVCALTGCAGCVDNSRPSYATLFDCINCSTVNGGVYAPVPTTPPTGVSAPANISKARIDGNKRALPVPADYGSYQEFILTEYSARDAMWVPLRGKVGGPGLSSALVERLGNKPVNMVVQRLYGCTSVIVVSNQGVWMSHLWEEPSFVFQRSFDEDVQRQIPFGDGTGWMPGLLQYTDTNGIFSPVQEDGSFNLVQTLIVTPRPWAMDDAANTYRYPEQVATISSWLRSTWGLDPIIFDYPTQGDSSDAFHYNTVMGKVLFQYDPVQARVPYIVEVDSQRYECKLQYAGLRLWAMDQETPLYDDFWLAQAHQIVLEGQEPGESGYVKRSIQPEKLLHATTGGTRILRRDNSTGAACTLLSKSASSSTISSSELLNSPTQGTTNRASVFTKTSLPILNSAVTAPQSGDKHVSTTIGEPSPASNTLTSSSIMSMTVKTSNFEMYRTTATVAPIPSPAYAAGLCSIYVWEESLGARKPVGVQVNISDAQDTLLSSGILNVEWGSTIAISKQFTKLPYDVVVDLLEDFPTSPKLKSTFIKRLAGSIASSIDLYKTYVIEFTAGSISWNSTDINDSRIPYCVVSTWNCGNFGDWIKAVLSLGSFYYIPNRNITCYFHC